MYISPNMSLEIWDLATDDFDYAVLSQNQALIDGHDHSAGKGRQINGGTGIAQASITQTQMASNSIGNPQLQGNSVGTPQLQNAAVTGPILANGSVGPGPIANGALTAALLDPTVIPLGTVVTWWRPPNSSAVPGGVWEIMDGRAWNQIQNAWGLTTGNIPDMRGRFARGAAVAGNFPGVGSIGGRSTVDMTHTHWTLGHTHGLPTHAHTIGVDGSHAHTWEGGYDLWMRTNAFQIATTIQGLQGAYHFNGYYSTYIKNLGRFGSTWEEESDVSIPGVSNVHPINDGKVDMDPAGGHSHGGGTGFWSGNTVSNRDMTDGSTMGNVDITPPYVGLLYIMRVR